MFCREPYIRSMLANLLLVVGLVALLAGAYLKFAGDPKPVPPMAAAAAAPATATPLTDEEKGLAFEQWVADRFPKRSFELRHWRSDKISGTGRYAESNRDPDLEVDLVLGSNRYPFAVECKWRARFNDGIMRLAEPYQVERYKAYAERTKRRVFIALGVGGTPSAPADLFIIPLPLVGNGTLSTTDLITTHRQSMSRTGFFFDVVSGTLKY